MQLKLGLDSNQLTAPESFSGMTGSGKTGLAVGLLEELVEAGVPLFVIDPKGDLTNLGLLFPECRADQLSEWLLRTAPTPRKFPSACNANACNGASDPHRWPPCTKRFNLRIFTPGSKAGLSIDLWEFPPPGPGCAG